MKWPWQKSKIETRATGSGFTAEIMAARESWISGSRGIGELTAIVQSCISLWEGGLSLADVTGTDALDRHTLALSARALALRGEAVFLIGDTRLIPCSDWDLSTRDGDPRAYRVSISEAGGGRTVNALAGEVLHLRIGSDVAAPWTGVAPLRRASITAAMLHAIEDALREVFEHAPLGSQVIPFPETPGQDMEKLGRDFRGRRGRVMLRESVNVSAAGGPMPQTDWKPQDTTPDLSRSGATETLDRARAAISMAFGVLPGMHAGAATGPLIREGQRHLAQWMLQPVAAMIAEEATAKLGGAVTLDVMRPLQAFDAGGRARAVSGIVQALATAKAGGVEPSEIAKAMELVDWQ